jgi:hypothetical protein
MSLDQNSLLLSPNFRDTLLHGDDMVHGSLESYRLSSSSLVGSLHPPPFCSHQFLASCQLVSIKGLFA